MTHPYALAEYARCFSSEYEPFYLNEAGCWVLLRKIPGTSYIDAIGCYPLSPIAKDAALDKDFAALAARGAVSLVLVTDPFFNPGEKALGAAFDKASVYKEHFINDLRAENLYESKNHHYKVRRALRDCEVKIIPFAEYLSEWCALYDALIKKHEMRGIQAFSHGYFRALSALDIVAVGAFSKGELVSCQLWLEHAGHVYSHLVVSSEKGYEIRAAYAVYDFSLRHFAKSGARLVDLGAGAGISEASSGLAMLKKGFSSASVPCYLCTKILNADLYASLSTGKDTKFFPAYRG